jgi:hypothetical protein
MYTETGLVIICLKIFSIKPINEKNMSGNPLGDITAEKDIKMLQEAFLETPDYKTIMESPDRCVIVGRRGTGKSALTYKLKENWQNQLKSHVIIIKPEEDQIIGLREIISLFGDKFVHIKAGAKIIWRYAVLMEICTWFSTHFKYKKDIDTNKIFHHLEFWTKEKGSFTNKIRKKVNSIIDKKNNPQTIVADLAENLELSLIKNVFEQTLSESKIKIYILVDGVDEGYSPDNIGIALIDGFLQTVIDLNSYYPENLNCFIFIRDNIFRAISILDPDFTRNIEAYILRLHWDEYNLFNLICNRIRIAFNDSTENNLRLWNKYAARELTGKDGFKIALRLTLYRPRDILVLLNNAFLNAKGQGRAQIVLEDIENSSKGISENRLNDLHKEYESIFPSIDLFTKSFVGISPYLSYRNASEIIQPIIDKDNHKVEKQIDLVLFESPLQVIERLYSVGFIGIKEEANNSYIFCHDGKVPTKEITESSYFLLHPCYWLALNISEQTLNPEETEEIFDEYDIEISSFSQAQRNQRIGALITEYNNIPPGEKGAYDFENWCFQVIRIIFAGSLCNIEIHPNKNGLQQRDIVATNLCTTPVWKRIFSDYSSRHVIFEIKNFEELGASEYRQMNSYLSGLYGTFGFIICRDTEENLKTGKDLNWAREIYFEHKKIIMKISGKFLLKHLSKQRSLEKHNDVNKAINNLLDRYYRNYLIIKSK